LLFDNMASKAERYGWAMVMATLLALAVPWFLWGVDRVAWGLPLWLWWHVGWMLVASVAFWVFSRRAWGIWIVDAGGETA
jgi:hypothetical protein